LGEDDEPVVLVVQVVKKIRTAEGERRTKVEEFAYLASSGKKIIPGFNVHIIIPVDLNGDGIYELVNVYIEGNGDTLDLKSNRTWNIGGLSAMACKFTGLPQEQILSCSPDGWI